MVREEKLRALFLGLDHVEEGTSYGTIAFRLKNKLFARMHKDGEHLVLKVGIDAKEALADRASETYKATPHYDGTDFILVELQSIGARELTSLIRESHARLAKKR